MSKEFLKIFEYFEIYEFDINNTEDVKKLIKLLWNECEDKVIELKSVLKEIRNKIKFERKISLSLNQTYSVSVCDRLLDIINKVIGEDK